MDFRELKYVLEVAKQQNITKAAEALYVGQPTVTKAIQNLEEDLGQKLFRKIGNKFVLTYAGEVYVKKAEQILLLKSELDQELTDIVKSNVGVLKVAFPIMRGSYMLPCTIPAFADLYPNVRLDLTEAESNKLEDMLLRGETDIAFFNLPIHSQNLDYELISHEELLLILPYDHPLKDKGIKREGCKYPWISLDLMKDEPFILYTQAQRTRQIADKLFKQYHIVPNIYLQTRNIEASLKLASQGYGACFCSETHLRHVFFEKSPLCFSIGEDSTSGKPGVTVDFVAAFRKNSYLPYHAKEYIKIVKRFT